MSRIVATTLLLATALVVSCQTTSSGPPPGDQGGSKPTASPSPQSTPTPGPSTGPSAQPPAQLSQEESQAAETARKQLSSDKSIPAEQIEVVTVEKVAWPDSSLGCPQPGFFYSQVITPGYRVILSAQGTTFEYHTAGTERAVLCKK